jgi:hypothetical protein
MSVAPLALGLLIGFSTQQTKAFLQVEPTTILRGQHVEAEGGAKQGTRR